jgi:hypothetical protein
MNLTRMPDIGSRASAIVALAFSIVLAAAGAASSQLRVQGQLAQVDATFVCPESLPSDEARQDAVKLCLEEVAAIEPQINVREVVSYRVALLRKHRCSETLRNIGELGGGAAPSQLYVRRAQIDLSVVKRFYGYLAAADGDRASELVIPEKRYSGPLSAAELTHYYAPMRVPLNLQLVELAPDGSVGVRHSYQLRGGRWCNGSANLYMTSRGSERLIGRIDAHHGC